jgi:hypothetical protein
MHGGGSAAAFRFFAEDDDVLRARLACRYGR